LRVWRVRARRSSRATQRQTQRTVLAEMFAKKECERGVLAYSEEFWGPENEFVVAWAMTTGGPAL